MITISPGHWAVGTGAKDLIDEVTEARKVAKRVTDLLRKAGITTNYIEDNTSKTQLQNIAYLIAQHQKTSRKLDVSVHFNSSTGRQQQGLGTEVLYYNNQILASKLNNSIAQATGLRSRGAKQRQELAFLRNFKSGILLEICFVNSTVDVELYRKNFDALCSSIAKELALYVGRQIDTKKDVRKMIFSSPALQSQTETTLASAARRQLIIDAAVAAGANKTVWQKKLEDGTITNDDLLGLAVKAIIDKK